ARKDEITDRNFRCREMLDDAFIDAFVTAANQNHLLGLRQSQRFRLIKPSSGCAQHDHFGLLALSNRLHSFEDRFRLEDHSFTAAERPVVYRAVPIRSEIPQIVDPYFDESFFPAAPNNAEIERPFEKLREDCDDVESHLFNFLKSSGRSTTIRC